MANHCIIINIHDDMSNFGCLDEQPVE